MEEEISEVLQNYTVEEFVDEVIRRDTTFVVAFQDERGDHFTSNGDSMTRIGLATTLSGRIYESAQKSLIPKNPKEER